MESVRIDKWLWAARFFKTRSLARKAVEGGKVQVDGQRVKPSRPLQCGQRLEIRKGELAFELIVEDLSERRGPAKVAQMLYRETEASVQAREQKAEQRRIERLAAPQAPERRPDKRDRRRIREFKENDK